MEDLKKSFLIKGDNIVGALGDKNFSTAPLGTVLSFAGQTAPHGYLLCDGASYKVADYPHLYAVIGNTYGGDSTNFNVPDYRETVLVGIGENTTDTIASHDVYELGEFKDDQFQGHWHNLGNSNGVNTVALGASEKGGSTVGANPGGENRYVVNTALDAITDGTNGEPRVGTTTHGKQKGITYIIKAKHTNEGVDSGVSDDVIEYVDNKVATKKDAVKLLNNATDSTKWLKLKLGSSATCQPIIVSDQYGGKVEITGMTDDGTYKSVKLVRYSYGDWSTYSATDYTLYNGVDPNYKIQKFYYYPTDGYYYLEIRQWATIKVEGNSAAELVTSLPAEKSEMTLIPESNWGRIDDSSTGSTSSTWSSSKIAQQDGIKQVFYASSTSYPSIFWVLSDATTGVFWFKHTLSDSAGVKSVEGYTDLTHDTIRLISGSDINVAVETDAISGKKGVRLTAAWGDSSTTSCKITEARPVTAIPTQIVTR